MGRYRKVEIRLYGDEKFRKLSPILPCGQGLWLYLITGPHTTSLPGLFSAGRAGLAEQLGWRQDAFDDALGEILHQGMAKADFQNRVIWIPNALRHNPPESPNVVKSWSGHLETIPECELKKEAITAIAGFLSTLGPAFLAAFQADLKPQGKASKKVRRKVFVNQKQEPNKEQEQQTESLALTTCEVHAASPVFIALPLNDRTEYPISEERVVKWEQLYPAVDVREELRKYAGWADAKRERRKTKRGILASVNSWLSKAQDNFKSHEVRNGSSRAQQRADSNRDAARRAFESIAGDAG